MENTTIKYIWADDIKKIKLFGRGKESGIRVWFKDAEEAVFQNIDVQLPENVVDLENMDNSENYDELLREVKADASLDKEYESSSSDDDDDDENGDNDCGMQYILYYYFLCRFIVYCAFNYR